MFNIANDHGTSAPATAPGRSEKVERAARHKAHVPEARLSVTGRTATAARHLLAGIRISLGWVFLWAFLDKLFGLGRIVPGPSWPS